MEMCLVLTQQDAQGIESNHQSIEMCLSEKQYHCLIGWHKLPLGTDKFGDIIHSEFAVLAPLTQQMLQSMWTAKTSDLDAPTGGIKSQQLFSSPLQLSPYIYLFLLYQQFLEQSKTKTTNLGAQQEHLRDVNMLQWITDFQGRENACSTLHSF